MEFESKDFMDENLCSTSLEEIEKQIDRLTCLLNEGLQGNKDKLSKDRLIYDSSSQMALASNKETYNRVLDSIGSLHRLIYSCKQLDVELDKAQLFYQKLKQLSVYLDKLEAMT